MDKLHRNGDNCERPEIRYDNHVLIEQRMFHTFNNKPRGGRRRREDNGKGEINYFHFFSSRCNGLSLKSQVSSSSTPNSPFLG